MYNQKLQCCSLLFDRNIVLCLCMSIPSSPHRINEKLCQAFHILQKYKQQGIRSQSIYFVLKKEKSANIILDRSLHCHCHIRGENRHSIWISSDMGFKPHWGSSHIHVNTLFSVHDQSHVADPLSSKLNYFIINRIMF